MLYNGIEYLSNEDALNAQIADLQNELRTTRINLESSQRQYSSKASQIREFEALLLEFIRNGELEIDDSVTERIAEHFGIELTETKEIEFTVSFTLSVTAPLGHGVFESPSSYFEFSAGSTDDVEFEEENVQITYAG